MPCLDYWKFDNNTQETPLCAALHDPEFLLARTGPGLSAADWSQRFDYVWTLVDEIYAAFDSTDVDWDEVRTKYVIDIRANVGGGPHEETLASFFIDEPIFYPCIQIREGDTYVPYDECPRPIVPDAAIHIEQPVAVLTSGLSASAADFFAYLMAQAPRAQLFGQPTDGAFGGITINDPPDGSYSLIITGTRISDTEGHPLQGKSVDPNVPVNLTLPDIIAGEDTVMNAGLAWLSSFTQ